MGPTAGGIVPKGRGEPAAGPAPGTDALAGLALLREMAAWDVTRGDVGGEIGRQEVRAHKDDRPPHDFHYHVGAEGLKAAMPTGDAWAIYHKALFQLQPTAWVDAANGTLLVVAPWVRGDGVVDVHYAVARFPSSVGPVARAWKAAIEAPVSGR